MPGANVTEMPFAKLYSLLVNKAERKGRTREEVDQVTAWLTGYTREYAQLLGRAERLRVYSLEEAKNQLEPGGQVFFFQDVVERADFG